MAKNTLEAERSTFYILNRENGDITANVFEDGIQLTEKNSKLLMYKKKQTVRLILFYVNGFQFSVDQSNLVHHLI